jgi:hypothetical protein
MHHPDCTAIAYINFLVAAPRSVTATEATRVAPGTRPPAHDSFTRLLHRREPDPAALWQEAAPFVDRRKGILIVDDSTLDQPYARKSALVTRHWSGKHRRVVSGINLITLLWTDGECLIPVDYRIYDKEHDGLTKNDHFLAMLATAQARGFAPECIRCDSWYSSLTNLKAIRARGWRWLTRLQQNRCVSIGVGEGNRAVGAQPISAVGTQVHLEGYGMIRVFRLVATDGAPEYWATNDEAMGEPEQRKYAEWSWGIEAYHRGLKQECGVERAQVRAARAQRNHIGLAIRAGCPLGGMRLEQHRLVTGISWWAAKTEIIRDAVRSYLAHPRYTLRATPWAAA